MSTTTLMNQLPKVLRDELKAQHLYDACFTDASKKTIKAGFGVLVVTGLGHMVERRQELLLASYEGDPQAQAQPHLLRDIEVLRYTLTLLDRETK